MKQKKAFKDIRLFSHATGTLAISCMLLCTTTAVDAQQWPQLADGRFVVTVRGVPIAFPAQETDQIAITFMTTDLAKKMSLAEVISFPDKARRFFAEEQRYFSISIPNGEKATGLFLGRFDRSALYGFRFSVSFDQNNCRAWSDIYDKDRARLATERTPVDANGWTEFYFAKSPPTWQYVRAYDLPGLPKHFDSFTCNYSHQCTSTICVGTNAAFTYQFHLREHPRETWGDVVRNAEDVFRYLFDVSGAPATDAR